MAHDLVVLGECNLDVIVGGDARPIWGQVERLVGRVDFVLGGSGAITALGAAKLGLSVALVAVLGDDEAGRRLLAEVVAAGVDTEAIVVRPQSVTGTSVILLEGEDRAILTAPGTIVSTTPSDVPDGLLSTCRWVHVSSYFLQIGLRPGLGALLDRARRAGAGVSIDPNWDPSRNFDELIEVLAPGDLLFVNEAEVCGVAGLEEPAAAARALAERGIEVVVKRGPAGAFVVSPAGEWSSSSPAAVVVDPVGAGDSFSAAFLACRLRGLETPGSLAAACAAAARTVTATGGTAAQVGLDELVAFSRAPADGVR